MGRRGRGCIFREIDGLLRTIDVYGRLAELEETWSNSEMDLIMLGMLTTNGVNFSLSFSSSFTGKQKFTS